MSWLGILSQDFGTWLGGRVLRSHACPNSSGGDEYMYTCAKLGNSKVARTVRIHISTILPTATDTMM